MWRTHTKEHVTWSTQCTEVNRDMEATDVKVYDLIFKWLCSGSRSMLKSMMKRRRMKRSNCGSLLSNSCSVKRCVWMSELEPGVVGWLHEWLQWNTFHSKCQDDSATFITLMAVFIIDSYLHEIIIIIIISCSSNVEKKQATLPILSHACSSQVTFF